MRQIKPQSGLLQTTPSQIGQEAFLGVAAGIGFRLSDPRILVHEATVWEAVAAAPRSAPLPAPTMPKRHAEWLLMGHSVHPDATLPSGSQVDWQCSVRLGRCEKSVSCRSQVPASALGETHASLSLDHTGAARGSNSENPVGTTLASPPLQAVGTFGVSASHTAGMGPAGTEWPARQRWMPARPGTVEEMAKDGTHMGWPARLDLRFFQLAPSNQWCEQRAWDNACEFELRSVGPRACGFRARLPDLAARVIYRHNGSQEWLQMQAELQTVWFLPDQDLGVMWWTGSIASEYFLDDGIDALLSAFHGTEECVATPVLADFAARRTSLSDRDPRLQGDSVLMPPIARGWTWELILDSSEHPRFGMNSASHAQACRRLAAHEAMLEDAGQRHEAAEHQQRQLALLAAPPEPPPGDRDWCAFFDAGPREALRNATIFGIDFGPRTFVGWRFTSVRFERCRFDGSTWRDCELESTHFVDCAFAGASWNAPVTRATTWRDCDLSRSVWRAARLEATTFETCRLEGFDAAGGDWCNVTLTRSAGAGGSLRELKIQALFCAESNLPDWRWCDLQATSLGLVDCHADRLCLATCELHSPSVLKTSLEQSQWRGCTVVAGVFGAGSSIAASGLQNCLFKASSWNEATADAVAVVDCSFQAFAAQHLRAARSSWQGVLLDEANAMHADFKDARFDRCSMRGIQLHGADLTNSCVEDCNLCDAKTGWALTSKRAAWRRNVEVGHLAIPRRHA